MNEFFKKIGIPATVAGFAGAVVTAALFIFQVDTRYAKTDDVQSSELRVNAKIDALTSEVSKLTGATQVLIQISTKMNVDQQTGRDPLVTDSGRVPASIAPPVDSIADVPLPPPQEPAMVASVVEPPPSPLVSQLRRVTLPSATASEIRSANPAEVQDLLKQTNQALNDSKENLKTIREF